MHYACFVEDANGEIRQREIPTSENSESVPSVVVGSKSFGLFVRIITGCIERSAKRRYLSYSEADFEIFANHRGDTLHRWGEIWQGEGTFGPIGAILRV